MTYGLSRLVSIWMSLYYNLPSLRLWHNQTGKNPTINECLDHLGKEQNQSTSRDTVVYKKVQAMFNRLAEFNCDNTSSLLEFSWTNALTTKSIPFSESVRVVSLIDFPRYSGASWPHNDIALYFPQFKKTAVMKISDSRFRPLREKLMVATQGLDPFIGTSFSIRHSKMHPIFNRVRCSRALPIDTGSFYRITSFGEQLDMLHKSFIPTSELASVLKGNAALTLDNYIIARYNNAYALWQFVTSDAILKAAKRDSSYNYTLKFDVDGLEASAWMLRNVLFDPNVEPDKYVGKMVRLGGFVLIGKSAMRDYRDSIHVLSVAPTDNLHEVVIDQKYHTGPTLKTVSIRIIEEELLDLNNRIYGAKKDVLSEEDAVEEQVMSEEAPIVLRPRVVKEAELPADQGRVLVIISSNKSRGFNMTEIIKRLQYEAGLHYSLESVRRILQQLCEKELALMNIFGDKWYIDPSLRVVASNTNLPEETVEPIVLDYLKRIYPQRINRHDLMSRLLRDDSRMSPNIVLRSMYRLRAAKKILNNKYKYYWNPYPPKDRSKSFIRVKSTKPIAKQEFIGTGFGKSELQNRKTIQLTEKEIEKIPTVFFFRQGDAINIFQKSGQVRKQMIFDSEAAASILKNLIADLKQDRYSSFEFIDYTGGLLKVRRIEKNRIEATYTNSSSNYLSMIAWKLK